jgi:hypothetical protein
MAVLVCIVSVRKRGESVFEMQRGRICVLVENVEICVLVENGGVLDSNGVDLCFRCKRGESMF